jgi:hypothetical protein
MASHTIQLHRVLRAPPERVYRMNVSATRTVSTTPIYPARSRSQSRSSRYRAAPNFVRRSRL